MIKIGIPTAYYKPTFGLHGNYIDWVAQFGQPILLTPYVDQYDQFDVLFLPGGADISNSRVFSKNRSNSHLDWFNNKYIRECITDKKPIFGICAGMQAINTYSAGTLRNLYPYEELIHCKNKEEDKSICWHTIPVKWEPWMGNRNCTYIGRGDHYYKDLKINTIHHQCIDKLGIGLQSILEVDDVIEAIKHVELPIAGVQWHPEKINDWFSKELFKSIL